MGFSRQTALGNQLAVISTSVMFGNILGYVVVTEGFGEPVSVGLRVISMGLPLLFLLFLTLFVSSFETKYRRSPTPAASVDGDADRLPRYFWVVAVMAAVGLVALSATILGANRFASILWLLSIGLSGLCVVLIRRGLRERKKREMTRPISQSKLRDMLWAAGLCAASFLVGTIGLGGFFLIVSGWSRWTGILIMAAACSSFFFLYRLSAVAWTRLELE